MKAYQLIKDILRLNLVRVVLGVCMVAVTAGSTIAQGPVNLNAIVHSQLPGGDVQINLVTDGLVGDPGSFSTDNPARIALDFFGMREQLSINSLNIGVGKVDSVVAVETPDRTRIIINLTDTARYQVLEAENGYAITVYNTEIDRSPRTQPAPFAQRPDVLPSTSVTNIDFRRSDAGGGSIIVDLNSDNVTVDTNDRSGEIVVDILGATLPAQFERRLDVVDFATPVQSIDAFQNSYNVRLVITPQGRYQHLSFQRGNRFNLVVDPIIETVEDEQNQEDLSLGYTGERLSINFQKIDVRSALAVIADFTGINFVTSDTVQGEITVNLKDVPWDQALDVIMRTKGLSKRQTGNVIWIAPTDEIARVEEEEIQAQMLAEEAEPLISEVIRINYARAEDFIDIIIPQNTGSGGGGGTDSSSSNNGLLTDRGNISFDERTNSLLIQDVASKIAEIRALLSELDQPIRQVMIETRIVQATDTFSKELGARLGFQRIIDNAQFPGASGSNIGDITTSGTTEGLATIADSQAAGDGLIFDTSRGVPGGLSVDLGANGIDGRLPASFAFDIFRAGTGFAQLITLELSALEADGRGKIVASPRLITQSQREAVITQGEERVFTVTTADSIDIEVTEAVLEVVVTPQITPDDRIIMDVSVTQDAFIPNPDPSAAAALSTTEIVTQVLASNGETIVIGGIYQEEVTEGTIKVPFLGDLPVIGNLFRTRNQSDSRFELLIFMTPKIISPKLNLG